MSGTQRSFNRVYTVWFPHITKVKKLFHPVDRLQRRISYRKMLLCVTIPSVVSLVMLAVAAPATGILHSQPIAKPSTYNALHRLQLYCNNPPLPVQDEGVPPVPGAVLQQVHVMFRHGDRSAIHSLKHPSQTESNQIEDEAELVVEANDTMEAAVVDAGASLRWMCTAPSQHEVQWTTRFLKPELSTNECVQSGACNSPPDHTSRTREAFEGWSRARAEGEGCGADPGQLSSIGWQQLLRIGEDLAHTYHNLLAENVPGTTPLRVTSTDTGRTMLSATAMLRGLIHGYNVRVENCTDITPEEWSFTHKEQTYRHNDTVCADLQHEPRMPQGRFPLLFHVLPREKDVMMFGNQPSVCSGILRWEKDREDDVWAYRSVPRDIADVLARKIGLSDVRLLPGVEETVDALYAGLCHGHKLPCWNADTPHTALNDDEVAHVRGATPEDLRIHRLSKALYSSDQVANNDGVDTPACITAAEAERLFQLGDMHYEHRFSFASTRSLMQPVLRQTLLLMRQRVESTAAAAAAVSAAASDPASASSDAPRMMLRAAHDTVLAPLLSVLGLVRRAYTWPGYASRIVFELWKPADARFFDDYIVKIAYNGINFGPSAFYGAPYVTVRDLTEFVDSLTHGEDWKSVCEGMDYRTYLRAASRTVRVAMLKAVLKLLPLEVSDKYSACMLMDLMPEHKAAGLATPIWDKYKAAVAKADPKVKNWEQLERFQFYETAKSAFAVVSTGEQALYANIILRKGVIG